MSEANALAKALGAKPTQTKKFNPFITKKMVFFTHKVLTMMTKL
jgi:hypothetical protein